MYQFTPEHRLKKADEFSSVFVFRKVRFGKYLKIHFKPNEFAHSRLGMIVSKKNHKKAVKRNYMKRLIREMFRHEQLVWNNVDIVVRVQKYFSPDDYQQVTSEFKFLTKIFKISKNPSS